MVNINLKQNAVIKSCLHPYDVSTSIVYRPKLPVLPTKVAEAHSKQTDFHTVHKTEISGQFYVVFDDFRSSNEHLYKIVQGQDDEIPRQK